MLTQPTSPLDLHMRMIVLATALGFMALEYALARLAHHDSHDLRESAASFGVAIGQSLIRSLEALGMAVPFAFAYRHRLFDFDQTSALALLGLFLGSEFLYYWHHRASHRVRWLWATHSVHHSPTKLNLTAAIRLGWTGSISGSFLFFLPLAWIGFHPLMIVGMLSVNLLYQFFIHTELSPRLGPLEWVLNTPGHHRVHHASNDKCLDKNYGGILIVFDRLFGTFAAAPHGEQLRYGLVGGTPTFNPFRIALGEWAAMLRDVRAAPSWRARISVLFAPPGAPLEHAPLIPAQAGIQGQTHRSKRGALDPRVRGDGRD
jgi:sterol desaturase/sphingolipid hydroxylase (fatty acid hydroxylase superfamily)